MDFTGVGILFGLFMTLIALLLFVLVACLVTVFQKRRNDRPISGQSGFRFLRVGAIFLMINIFVFLLTLLVYEIVSRELKSALDGVVFFGWLPLNLLAVFVTLRSSKKN